MQCLCWILLSQERTIDCAQGNQRSWPCRSSDSAETWNVSEPLPRSQEVRGQQQRQSWGQRTFQAQGAGGFQKSLGCTWKSPVCNVRKEMAWVPARGVAHSSRYWLTCFWGVKMAGNYACAFFGNQLNSRKPPLSQCFWGSFASYLLLTSMNLHDTFMKDKVFYGSYAWILVLLSSEKAWSNTLWVGWVGRPCFTFAVIGTWGIQKDLLQASDSFKMSYTADTFPGVGVQAMNKTTITPWLKQQTS